MMNNRETQMNKYEKERKKQWKMMKQRKKQWKIIKNGETTMKRDEK